MTTSLLPLPPFLGGQQNRFQSWEEQEKEWQDWEMRSVGDSYMIRIGREASSAMFLFENREVDVIHIKIVTEAMGLANMTQGEWVGW